MSDNPAFAQIEIHKLVSEELRHTSTVVWKFAIAIVTLQGGAVALSGQAGSQNFTGKFVAVVAFLLSIAFSLMLVRQARERSGFIDRIKAVEGELAKTYSVFMIPIPTRIAWFKSEVLAWVLVVESTLGLIALVCQLGIGRAICDYVCR